MPRPGKPVLYLDDDGDPVFKPVRCDDHDRDDGRSDEQKRRKSNN
jgi:hypothetical protein